MVLMILKFSLADRRGFQGECSIRVRPDTPTVALPKQKFNPLPGERTRRHGLPFAGQIRILSLRIQRAIAKKQFDFVVNGWLRPGGGFNFLNAVIFPKWMNWLPLALGIGAALACVGVAAGVTYYSRPNTPVPVISPCSVPFSHRVHAGQLGLDCRYCHNGVEKSWYANPPAAATCMSCHNQVLKDDPRLQIVRDSAANHTPGAVGADSQAAGLRLFQPLRPRHARHQLRGMSRAR